MSEYIFDFLQELDPELVQLGRSIDKIFYDDPHGVLVKGRLFAERMTKTISGFEELDNLKNLKQVERVAYLDKEGLFTKEVAQAFDMIRVMGNRAAHSDGKGDLEKALNMHKQLFKISAWLVEVYGSYDSEIPEYVQPRPQSVDAEQINHLIKSTLSRQLASILKEQAPNYDYNNKQTSGSENTPPDQMIEKSDENTSTVNEEIAATDQGATKSDYDTLDSKTSGSLAGRKKLNGSYLMHELSKLKESSQEAVEGSAAISRFKEYLHVKRPIQDDLKESLQDAAEREDSQLILLCGSVGDGKSHLLAYMNSQYPDLMSHFEVHNDATESFDPKKNSLDTLAEVLRSFDDNHIHQSNEKRILAINLGVLNNFLESSYAKEQYRELASFIYESKVFDENYIPEKNESTHFRLISFSNYHPYELTEKGPISSYISEIFAKIVQSTSDNPFYQAFKLDKENDVSGPFMINFQLLQNKQVQEKLAQLLIKAIVQHKYILSTRSLFNFIHDILIPAEFEKHWTTTSLIEYTQVLLPNLIFDSRDRSPLLKVLSFLDPIHVRSETIDRKLIELNNANDISFVFNRYLDLSGMGNWGDTLSDLGPFYELTKATQQMLNASLIRFGYFLSIEMQGLFSNEVYKKYMEYLYAFNVGVPKELKGLFEETEKAVFSWKGKPRRNSNYIYHDSSIGKMSIAQSLNLKRYTGHLVGRDEVIFKRFKDTLTIGFQDEQKRDNVLLEIDYPLYETMIKVLDGYRPNKKDKEDAIQFLEFIDNLMALGQNQDQLIIHDMASDMIFKLVYDSEFEEFTFERE